MAELRAGANETVAEPNFILRAQPHLIGSGREGFGITRKVALQLTNSNLDSFLP
jgi:hypothetical protein